MAICTPAQIKGGVGARTGPSLSKANIGNAFRRQAGGIRTNDSNVIVRYCDGGSAGVGGKLRTHKAFAVGARLSPRQVIVTQFLEYIVACVRQPTAGPRQWGFTRVADVRSENVAGATRVIRCTSPDSKDSIIRR